MLLQIITNGGNTMKKIILVLSVIVLCFLVACNGIGKMEVREPNEYEGGTIQNITKYRIKINHSVKELVDTSDLIIEARLLSNLGSFDTSKILKEAGYNDVGDETIYTFYEMKVIQSIKGEVQKGETIKVRIRGGLYNDILYADEYSEKLTDDFDYIFFLNNSEYNEMPYELTSMAQGYLPFKENELSLNKKISNLSLFTQGQSKDSVIANIKNEMSSQKELVNKKAEMELQKAQNSLVWTEENGITIYEGGNTGKLKKYPVKSTTSETITSFLRSIKVSEKIEATPTEKIYHIGFYGAYENEDKIYMTISLTDNAVLCNGDWYKYECDINRKISEIFKDIKLD